tara:strand:+ start:148342 stop:148941 length:600 start_codon:yes stop_codon:yes gene_type:complete
MTAFIVATMLYALSMSITPGPTNIIMMSTGVNHGFKSTVPFATGAAFGFTALVVIVALGFGTVLTENKDIMQFMAYVGAAMISYMGYKIAFSSSDIDESANARPSFMYGAVLQWLNPKSWIACLAGVSAFNLAAGGERLMLYMSVYMVVGYLCVLSWGFAGAKISRFLKIGRNLRIFNYIMGASLVIVAVYLALMDQTI